MEGVSKIEKVIFLENGLTDLDETETTKYLITREIRKFFS